MKTSAKKTIEAAIDEVVALARRVVPPRMTAAVLYGSEDLRIEEIEVPSSLPTKFFCGFGWRLPTVPT